MGTPGCENCLVSPEVLTDKRGGCPFPGEWLEPEAVVSVPEEMCKGQREHLMPRDSSLWHNLGPRWRKRQKEEGTAPVLRMTTTTKAAGGVPGSAVLSVSPRRTCRQDTSD